MKWFCCFLIALSVSSVSLFSECVPCFEASLEDSAILKYERGRVYFNPERVSLKDEGVVISGDTGEINVSHLFHDSEGYYFEKKLDERSVKNINPDDIHLTQAGAFLKMGSEMIRIDALFSSENGQYSTILSSHDCPPLMKLCDNCRFACNPFWSGTCHHCGGKT